MACFSSAPAALSISPDGYGDFPPTLYHPSARRPISFAPNSRLLLDSLDDKDLSPSELLIKSKKRYRLSLPSSGICSEPERDRAAAGFRGRADAYANEYIRVIPSSPWDRNSEADNKMAQLITLQLRPTLSNKRDSTLLDAIHNVPRSPPPLPPPRIPAKSKRRSISNVLRVTNVCYTIGDWKRAMEEIKLLFARKQWKSCAAKCKQLLSDSQHQPHIHSAYTVYLNFYVALCLEQTARSLSNSSPLKLALLRESCSHLHQTKTSVHSVRSSGMARQDRSFRQWTSPSSTNTSSASSERSSSSCSNHSLFSPRSSSLSSASSAPQSPDRKPYQHHRRQSSIINFSHKRNTSSTSSAILRPAPLRIQKRVSFSSNLDTFDGSPFPPHSRPKHPCDVQSPPCRMKDTENWDLIDCFPMPPSPSRCPSLVADSESESEDYASSSSSTSPSPCPPESELSTKITTPPPPPSLARFHTSLRDFESQLTWHLRSVQEQICTLEKGVLASLVPRIEIMSEDEKKKDVLRRIKERRRTGWERTRFDGSRYQRLCDVALVEIDGVLVLA